jgi:hypothetical protein
MNLEVSHSQLITITNDTPTEFDIRNEYPIEWRSQVICPAGERAIFGVFHNTIHACG